MNEKDFSLNEFIKRMHTANSLSHEEVQYRNEALINFDTISYADYITDEMLDNLTLQQLEWVKDLIMYWPTFEAEFEPDDANHHGFQKYEIISLMKGLSKKKSIKRQVAFI
jgi:hypothetical protein